MLHRGVGYRGRVCCLSPYSVASALGLARRAARGTAAGALDSLLAGSDADIAKQAELLHGASALKAQPGREAPVLAVSNTLWAWAGVPLNEEFLDEAASRAG